jgi:uncharacterized protein (TIGR02598 family)
MRTAFRSGFTLVEICLALGIAVFCLVAIFSLLPAGLRGNLESSEETVATGILTQVVTDLRSCPVTSPRGQAATTPQFGFAIPANPVTAEISGGTRYFSEAAHDGPSPGPSSLYRVDVTFLPNGAANAATLAHVKASWPAAAPQPTGRVETFVALDRN